MSRDFHDSSKMKPQKRQDVEVIFSDGSTGEAYFHKTDLSGDVWVDSKTSRTIGKSVKGWRIIKR